MKKKYKKGMNRRTFIKLASGSVIGVSSNWFLPKFSWGAREEIRIGGVFELSGGLAALGTEQAQGAELAVKLINETGGGVSDKPGVLGRPVRLLTEDTESKVSTGLSKAKKLVERDKVCALTGILMSSISMAIQAYIKQVKVPFVNSGSGNDQIIEPPHCGRHMFKLTGGNPQLCKAAEYPAKKYGTRAYLIADNFAWGYNVTKFFKKAIERVGKLELVGETYPPFNTDNYSPYITKIQAVEPDFVAVGICGGGYVRFIKQASQMGLKIPQHHNFYSRPDLLAVGDAGLGLTFATDFLHDNPKNPRSIEITEKSKAFTGEYMGANGAKGFDGIETICKAIQEGKSTDPEKIVENLENLVFENSIVSPGFRFRKCDHAVLITVYIVENVKHPKYKYDAKLVEEVKDPAALMTPCGQTGCEELMKKT